MNKVQILGTITKEIEVRYTQSGSAIASFGVAYNDKWKDQSGQVKEKAHFFDVTAFGKQAETINQYFHKGSRILIDGSLDFQLWTAQDGSKRSKVGIKLNSFSFIDRKADTQPQQDYPQATPQNNVDDPSRHNVGGNMNRPAQHQQAIPEIDIADDQIHF